MPAFCKTGTSSCELDNFSSYTDSYAKNAMTDLCEKKGDETTCQLSSFCSFSEGKCNIAETAKTTPFATYISTLDAASRMEVERQVQPLSTACASFVGEKKEYCEKTDTTRPNYCEWNSAKSTCGVVPKEKLWPSKEKHDGFVDTCSTKTSKTSCTKDTYCRWYKDDAGMDTCGTFLWDPMEGVGDGEHLKMDANCKKITEPAQCNYNEHICPNPDFEVMDEGGNCVPKLWPDWVSCEEDMRQGSCPSKENNEYLFHTDGTPFVDDHTRLPEMHIANMCPVSCRSFKPA